MPGTNVCRYYTGDNDVNLMSKWYNLYGETSIVSDELATDVSRLIMKGILQGYNRLHFRSFDLNKQVFHHGRADILGFMIYCIAPTGFSSLHCLLFGRSIFHCKANSAGGE